MDITSPLHQNIFLVGFMGSGKSYWGKIWAKNLGYSFYDLDEMIEEAWQMTVDEIFEKEGEDKFRELERDYLHQLETKDRYVVSCGGGTPCFFDNLRWMQQHGKVIYLKASPGYILGRVIDETLKRPLLKQVDTSELLVFIQQKLKEREPVYLQAHHVLEVEDLNNDSLAFLR